MPETVWTSALVFLTATVAFCAQVTPTGEPPQTGLTQNSTLRPRVESKTLGPDLPLSSVPTSAVSVRFVVEHRTALNGHPVRVRGIITDALLGDAACSSNRGMCVQPSIIMDDADCGENQFACSIRVLMPGDTKPRDYQLGKLLEIRAVASGDKTGVLLTKADEHLP